MESLVGIVSWLVIRTIHELNQRLLFTALHSLRMHHVALAHFYPLCHLLVLLKKTEKTLLLNSPFSLFKHFFCNRRKHYYFVHALF